MLVTATARLRYVSIPPRKMRLVADLVQGMPVEKALNILNFTPRIAARHIAKTLKSAAANALSQEGTDHLKPESLHVKQITVDTAPTAKRIRFQSMGRAFRYRKRHCHLTVILEGETDVARAEKTTRRAAYTPKKEVSDETEAAEKAIPRKKQAERRRTATEKARARGAEDSKIAGKRVTTKATAITKKKDGIARKTSER
ncbi:MAG: 50S ribosomal protein L22 [Candidatus Zixiibacteriota bacterium]